MLSLNALTKQLLKLLRICFIDVFCFNPLTRIFKYLRTLQHSKLKMQPLSFWKAW